MTYSDLKELVAKKNLAWQHEELSDRYNLFAVDSGVRYEATIWKATDGVAGADPSAEAANITDFEDNYKAASNWAIGMRPYAFATPDFQFEGNGLNFLAAHGEVTSGDFKILEAGQPGLYINGGDLYTKNSEVGDYIVVQVVDVDNILGAGAGYVANEWVKKWYVSPSGSQSVTTPYAGKIPGGLYLRVVYHSAGDTDVKVAMNLKLHLAI